MIKLSEKNEKQVNEKNAKCNNKNCKCEEKSQKKEDKELNKQIKDLEKELKEANETIEDLTENYIKTENLTKSLNISCVELKKDIERIKERNKNIVEEANDSAVINVVKEFLPILDNFEQALKVVSDKDVLHGFELIYNQTKTMLKNLGIDEIVAIGEEFDPEQFNCVMREQNEDKEKSNKVANEFQKGYKYKDKIIRHSVVSVFE